MRENIHSILSRLIDLHNVELPGRKEEQQLQESRINALNDIVGELDKVDGYNCTVCKNKGCVYVLNEEGQEVYRDCKCKIIRRTLRRAKRSGLGDVITEYTFDKFITAEEWQQNLKQSAIEFCNDDTAKWFFIGGQVGAGKTHICTAISAHYMKCGQDMRYMLWAEDSKKLKAMVNDAKYQELISEYKSVDVLYIDDFLKVKNGEEPTAGDINLAFEIINHRLLDNDKITIISTEKLLSEIIDYDEGTMSRIFQKAGRYKFNIERDRSRNYRLRG